MGTLMKEEQAQAGVNGGFQHLFFKESQLRFTLCPAEENPCLVLAVGYKSPFKTPPHCIWGESLARPTASEVLTGAEWRFVSSACQSPGNQLPAHLSWLCTRESHMGFMAHICGARPANTLLCSSRKTCRGGPRRATNSLTCRDMARAPPPSTHTFLRGVNDRDPVKNV